MSCAIRTNIYANDLAFTVITRLKFNLSCITNGLIIFIIHTKLNNTLNKFLFQTIVLLFSKLNFLQLTDFVIFNFVILFVSFYFFYFKFDNPFDVKGGNLSLIFFEVK